MLLSVLILASLCTGCKETVQDMPDEKEVEETVLEVYAGQSERESLGLLAEAFEGENPEISVNLHFIPDSEYTQQMMKIKNHEAEADSIFFPDTGEAVLWREKGILKDLAGWSEDSLVLSYYQNWYANMEEEEKYSMIPYRIGRICVYYNKTLFDAQEIAYPEDGWTWEELKETAAQLTGWSGNEKVYGAPGFEASGYWWTLPARTRGAADPFREEDLAVFQETAQWCHEFTSDLSGPFSYAEWGDDVENNYYTLFLEGRLGMFFGDDTEVKTLNQDIEEQGLSLEYGVASLPAWNGGDYTEVFNTATASVAEASAHPDEAFHFIEFCTGQQGAEILAENNTVPAWQTDEICEIYLGASESPAGRECFLMGEVPAETAVGNLYQGGMEIMRQQVSLYLMDQQELEYTFRNIRRELDELSELNW